MDVLLISAKKAAGVGGIAVWTEHYLSRCNQHNIHCTLVNTEKGPNKKNGDSYEFNRTNRIFKNLKLNLNNNHFDIAHLNTSCGPLGLFRDYAIAKKIKRTGIPIATHYHCDIPRWINNPISCFILKRMARISNLNLVLCENSRLYLKQFGISSIKVPNFIREDIITEKPKEIRETLSRILFVGRISYPKGAAEIYELAKRFPEKTFALVGSVLSPVDSWEKPMNVLMAGRSTSRRVMEILDQADLFLFPSHSEGFSLALMEAMARGVPCIAFDSVGANSDMLADNCGITVPFGNVDAMEQAIRDLEDPEKRKAISEKAIAKVRDNYTTDAVLTLFKSLYNSQL